MSYEYRYVTSETELPYGVTSYIDAAYPDAVFAAVLTYFADEGWCIKQCSPPAAFDSAGRWWILLEREAEP